MDFADFVKRTYRDEHDAIGRNLLQRLGRALERSGSLETLLNNDDPAIASLTPTLLFVIADARRDYWEWKEAAKTLRRTLSSNNLNLPDGSLIVANTPQELEVLGWTASFCQRSGFADHESWAAAVRAHIELWRACVQLSLDEGSVAVSSANSEHPEAAEFENYIFSKKMLSELKGYTWLAIRRGEHARALSVSIDLPLSSIEEQTRARLPELGLVAQKLGAEELTKDFILAHMDRALRSIMDRRAEKEALGSARGAYWSLLKTPPLEAEKIISIWAGSSKGPLGAVVLDKKGDVIDNLEIPYKENPSEAIAELKMKHQIEAAVYPVSTQDPKRWGEIEQAVDLPFQSVHDAAIAEARKNLPFAPAVSSAVVLGRRSLRPAREWCRVDPLSLGLGEYPRDLEEQKLGQVLKETKMISSWERRQKNSPSKANQSARRAANLPSGKRLNPFIKTIRDLKTDMMVDGVITNLTRFGAFVNIGLPVEGMIHVSQLSNEFIEDPAQLVSVGQQVKARILEVVPEKDRIALSLKPAPERRPQDTGPVTVKAVSSKPRRESPKTRSAALADLDALFKK